MAEPNTILARLLALERRAAASEVEAEIMREVVDRLVARALVTGGPPGLREAFRDQLDLLRCDLEERAGVRPELHRWLANMEWRFDPRPMPDND